MTTNRPTQALIAPRPCPLCQGTLVAVMREDRGSLAADSTTVSRAIPGADRRSGRKPTLTVWVHETSGTSACPATRQE